MMHRIGLQDSERSVAVHVIGPAVLARALESLLSVQAGVDVRLASPEMAPDEQGVVIFVGPERVSPTEVRDRVGSATPRSVLLTDGADLALGGWRTLNIRAFVGNDEPLTVVLDAIRAAARGEAYCSPQLFPAMVAALYGEHQPRPALLPSERAGGPTNRFGVAEAAGGLSHREREVATEAAQGFSNEAIADRLHISVSTVKFHLFHAFRKLGVTRRAQLRYALPQPA